MGNNKRERVLMGLSFDNYSSNIMTYPLDWLYISNVSIMSSPIAHQTTPYMADNERYMISNFLKGGIYDIYELLMSHSVNRCDDIRLW